MAVKYDIQDKNRRANMAARGAGPRSDLTPYDTVLDSITNIVGDEEGQFKSFDEAYDAYASTFKNGLSDRHVMRGRLLKRLDYLKDSGALTGDARQKTMTKLGISSSELKSMVERFAGGAASMLNKIQYGFEDITGTLETGDTKLAQDTNEILSGEEKFYQGYSGSENANVKEGFSTGKNFAGGFGGVLPELAGGGFAGMIGKKVATQFFSEVGMSTGLAALRSRLDDGEEFTWSDFLSEVGTGLVAARVGSGIQNSLDTTKAGRQVGNSRNISDLTAAKNGMELLSKGDTKIPFKLISNPDEVATNMSTKKSTQEVLDTKKALDDVEATAGTKIDEALDNISTSPAVLKGRDNSLQDPVAMSVIEQINDYKTRFKNRAKPFTDAYKSAGENIDIDIGEVMTKASKITDPDALTKFETVVKNNMNRINETKRLKLMEESGITNLSDFRANLVNNKDSMKALFKKYGVKNYADLKSAKGIGPAKLKEIKALQRQIKFDSTFNDTVLPLEKKSKIGDMSQFNANDVDLITQQVGQELRDSASSMTPLSNSGSMQLGQVEAMLKDMLGNQDKAFSGPYKKAKSIYSDMYKLTGSDTKIGNVDKAMKEYKKTGNTSAMRNLLNMNGGFENNMENFTQMLPKGSDAYKGLTREMFDNRLLKAKTNSTESPLDIGMYSSALNGIDWSKMLRNAPEGAVDSMKTLSGYQSIFDRIGGTGGNVLSSKVIRDSILDKSDRGGLFNPITWPSTIYQSTIGKVPGIKNWYDETDIGLASSVASQLQQVLPSGSRKFVMGSAKDEGKLVDKRLKQLKEQYGTVDTTLSSELPLLDKLNPEYDFTK